MPDVLKLPPFHLPRRQGQPRMFALQCLYPGQLISAHHSFPRLDQGGSISVQVADVIDFGVKVLVLRGFQPIAYPVRFQVPLSSSLAAWRGEIRSTMPCWMISSANSRLVHWLIGRPLWLGASHARDMIWQTCSGVIRAGAPGRGASRNLSSRLRSSKLAAGSPSQRLRQNRTVSTSRLTSRAIWLLFRPAAADRMTLPRRANCWGVLNQS